MAVVPTSIELPIIIFFKIEFITAYCTFCVVLFHSKYSGKYHEICSQYSSNQVFNFLTLILNERRSL